MSEFITFFRLGCDHILDWQGYDHILFLLTLVAPFTIRQWRSILFLVTAFTLGHALTLIMVSLDVISWNGEWIETAIATTILVSALNLIFHRQIKLNVWIYLLTFGFGLIHGMGFAGYLTAIMGSSDVVIPLLAFNLGVEVGQVIFVVLVCLIQYVVDQMGLYHKRFWTLVIGLVGLILSLQMIWERI